MAEGDPQMVTDKYQTFMVQKDSIASSQALTGKSGFKDFDLSELENSTVLKGIHWVDVSIRQSMGNGDAVIKYAAVLKGLTSEPAMNLKSGELIRVGMIVFPKVTMNQPGVQLVLNGQFSAEVFNINNHHLHQPITLQPGKPNLVVFEFTFPSLVNGNYSVSLAVSDLSAGSLTYFHLIHDAMMLNVENSDVRYKLGTQMVVEDAKILQILINP
jgi:hypothetical protein